MKHIYSLLFSLALVSSCNAAKTGQTDADHKVNKKSNTDFKSAKIKSSKLVNYTVNSGDTLYSIARAHHTTVAKVALINGLEEDGSLKMGKALKILPNTSSDKKTSSGISLASVIGEIDKGKKKVQTGKGEGEQSITIASVQKTLKKQSSKKSLSYKVKKGDSLYAIALKNNTTVDKLKKLNKIKSEKNLRLGQVLVLSGEVPQAEKPKLKVAKVKKVTKTKTKVAKAKTQKKKTQKIVFSNNTSQRKLVIDANTGKTSFLSLISKSNISTLKLKSAKKQLGKRYVWGATGPYNFDCSGFTSYVCKKNGVCIPRTSINQSKVGKRVSRKNLKAGDLVFFDTSKRRKGYINHVGIYMGNNKFIHASSAKKKVVISSLEKPFYKSRFKWGSRVKG